MKNRALEHITYREYLQTDHWRRIRWATLWLSDGRCQLCRSEKNLEVHHNNYDCLFDERPEDLVALCNKCHGIYSIAEASQGVG